MRASIEQFTGSIERTCDRWNRNPETFYTRNEDGESVQEALNKAHPELDFKNTGSGCYGLVKKFEVTRFRVGRRNKRTKDIISKIDIIIDFSNGEKPAKKRPSVYIEI